MPKRGGGRMVFNGPSTSGSRYSSLRDYHNDHDERERERPKERNNTRRVSFKPPPTRGMKARMGEMANRYRTEDDEDMDGLTNSMYGDRLPRRKGSPIPKGKFGNNHKLNQNTFGWYQVIVKSGQRYSKDELLRALIQAVSPDIFIPHYWRTDKHEVVFFVDNFQSAERLQSIDRSLQMPDGYRLLIRVHSGCPIVSVDEPFKERMKLAMAKRYNAQTRALDLSKFHTDSDFKDMFCALFRAPVMSAALDIIEKNIPEIEALNLNENHISTMEAFKNVGQRLPNLKILYLGDNKIPSLAHLMVLRSVPIIELVLKQNPLRKRYKDQALYVRYKT